MKYINRPVDQYTKDGKYIQTFNSIREAAQKMNVTPYQITAVCLHKPRNYTTAGYIWTFKGEDYRPVRENLNRIPVVKLSLEDKSLLASYNSIKEASEDTSLASESISRGITYGCPRGGFYWMKKADYEALKTK